MSWELLIDSCVLAFLVAFLAVGFGWCASLFLVGSSGWKRVIFLACLVSSFSLPPFLVVNTWLGLFGKVGLLKPWFSFDVYSFVGAVWVLVMLMWPVPCLMSFGALKRLTPELLDAEPGLRGWGLIKCVLFPLSYSALFQSGVIVFVLAFNNIAVPAILQVKVFPSQFWVQFSSTYNFQTAWQYGCVSVLIPMITLFKEGPKTDVMNNGKINGGKARKPSVMRITTLSIFLFDTADIIPIGTPIIIDKKTTPKATLIDDMLA